jgi:hypothetical protein
VQLQAKEKNKALGSSTGTQPGCLQKEDKDGELYAM